MPSALYGAVLLMAGLSYTLLQRCIITAEGPDALLARAVGKDLKGKLSLVIYAAAIGVAFWNQWIAQAGYVLVALLWLVPDRRIEKLLAQRKD
jgi:uncharacterized membrane protein